MNERSSEGPERVGTAEGDPLIEDAEIVEDGGEGEGFEPDCTVGDFEAGEYEPGGFDTSDPAEDGPAAGGSAGGEEITVAESPAYAFLVGSKRVRVAPQVGPRPPREEAPAPVPAPRDPYAPEVVGAAPDAVPDPGPLPGYSDALPHLSVPDAELDGADHDGLVLRAASLRGDAARAASAARRDAVRLARIGEGRDALLVLAAADGLGTAEYSHVGAHYACSTIVETVAGFHPELLRLLRSASGGPDGGNGAGGAVAPGEQPDDVRRLVNYAQEMCRRTDVLLEKLAQQAELPAEQCATSLRCLLVPVDPEVDARLMFSVGGGAFVRLRAGEWLPIEVADEEAARVGLPGGWEQARVSVQSSQPGDLLIACTDGLSELLPTPGVAERLADWWGGSAPGLAEFLHQMQLRVRPFGDDRSAACVWERPGPSAG